MMYDRYDDDDSFVMNLTFLSLAFGSFDRHVAYFLEEEWIFFYVRTRVSLISANEETSFTFLSQK